LSCLLAPSPQRQAKVDEYALKTGGSMASAVLHHNEPEIMAW
jgi:hypothetical protein